MRAKSQPAFLNPGAYQRLHKAETRGGVVSIQGNSIPQPQGFSTADILWGLGVWSVILFLSPVIVFYVLMVA
jgi:hypothetical protein